MHWRLPKVFLRNKTFLSPTYRDVFPSIYSDGFLSTYRDLFAVSAEPLTSNMDCLASLAETKVKNCPIRKLRQGKSKHVDYQGMNDSSYLTIKSFRTRLISGLLLAILPARFLT